MRRSAANLRRHYYHPFALPREVEGLDLLPHWLAGEAGDVSWADACTLQERVCEAGRAPKRITDAGFRAPMNYAYHLDAGRFGAYLARLAKSLGVQHLLGTVSRVDLAQMRDELKAMIHFARDGGLAREPKFNEVPWLTRDIKDIAFSGDGEPTMIHNFSECVQVVADVKREEGLDRTKIVLITDAAGLDTADVRRGLELMDANHGEVWAKLDAGSEGYYKLVNRTTVRFDRSN